MQFCKTCGKQLNESAKFCNGCGKPVVYDQVPDPVPTPRNNLRFRMIRAVAATLAALIIATMLLGWISVSIDIDRYSTETIMRNLNNIITEWFESHIDLVDTANALYELRTHDAVNTRLDEFLDELVDDLRRDFGQHIELGSDFVMADVLTDEVISDLVADADEFIDNLLDEFLDETLGEIRRVLEGVSGTSFSASYTVHGSVYLARLLATVSEVGGDFTDLDTSTVLLAANILRAVWAICVLLLSLFLFLLIAELKITRLMGLLGFGLAFVLALAFTIGLFVGSGLLPDAIGDFLQIGATIWVYICLGLSLAAFVLLAVNKRLVNPQ